MWYNLFHFYLRGIFYSTNFAVLLVKTLTATTKESGLS